MSSITLLSAKMQLTKKFSKSETGDLITEPYPFAKNFTSIERPYDTIQDLKAIITAAANTGYCVLKGQLDRPLNDEPRKGHTSSITETDLLVLDYDENAGFDGPDALLAAIDPALENVSYIWQPSASAGIKVQTKIRGHAFIRLARPIPPSQIKEWVIKLNHTVPELQKRIHLSKNGMSLCYPLDVTVNQNDKLIYIAPPTCIDFEDPIPEDQRIVLVEKQEEFYDLNPRVNPQMNQDLATELAYKLQEEAGMARRPCKFRLVGDENILANPARCNVTGRRDCGDYVRLNLNGGDSWAYYYNKENPEILWNFKGEPATFLRLVAPTYWAEYVASRPAEYEENQPIVFRDVTTDTYYNGIVNYKNDEIVSLRATSSKDKLLDFVRQFGRDPPDSIQDWNYEFRPQEARQIDRQKRWINAFTPTPYMEMREQHSLPPTIEKVLRHICVTNEHFSHFLNWLAYIFQTRSRSQTAWLFQGTEGTGKGTLYSEILRPLFGPQYTFFASNDSLTDQFNAFLENKLVLFIDEGDTQATKESDKMMALLRTYITDDEIPIRAMRRAAINRENFLNIIVATNQSTPIRITSADRRWNVAPRQQKPIDLTDDYDLIPKELDRFACFLNNYACNTQQARTTIKCEARDRLIDLGRSRVESFIDAIRNHDLDYFLDFITDTPELPATSYYAFESVVKSWAKNAGYKFEVNLQDVKRTFAFIAGKEISEKAFSWMMANAGFEFERKRVDGTRGRWATIQFNPPTLDVTFNETNNVLDFKRPA